MYQQFTLNSLTSFSDGKVAAAFDRIVREAVKDCMDRPGEKSARTVELKVNIKPRIEQEGMTEGVEVEVSIGGKNPKYHSAAVHCSSQTTGQMFFNDLSPEEPQQRTIDE